MGEWKTFNDNRPMANDLVIYYVPSAKYVWGVGSDYDHIKQEYPAVSHWRVVSNPPA